MGLQDIILGSLYIISSVEFDLIEMLKNIKSNQIIIYLFSDYIFYLKTVSRHAHFAQV